MCVYHVYQQITKQSVQILFNFALKTHCIFKHVNQLFEKSLKICHIAIFFEINMHFKCLFICHIEVFLL